MRREFAEHVRLIVHEGNTMIETIEMSVEPLTPREQQVAAAVARGLRNREIGIELGISAETVKRHLASIYSKLSISGRVALALRVERSRAA